MCDNEKPDAIRRVIREGYGAIARADGNGCSCGASASCRNPYDTSREAAPASLGYSKDALSSVPQEANLGLGCGNPIPIAALKKGEAVLDLGCGSGFDCFFAANRVGYQGQVIGVDMTWDMVAKAKTIARKNEYHNVEFMFGQIERLPVADNSVDVVISNCVINLSPAKERVFAEVLRVLKPDGRLVVSDTVLLKKLPKTVMDLWIPYIGCLAGAMPRDEYIKTIRQAGFADVKIVDEIRIPIEMWAKVLIRSAICSEMESKSLPQDTMAAIGWIVSLTICAVNHTQK